MSNRVFISYCAQDKEKAYEVCRLLEQQDHLCWIAPRDVGVGMIYAEQIVKAIRDCSALVLICSSASNRSSHVRNEVERAFSHDKPILPFRIEETEPGDALEYFLGSSQWLDAWEGDIEKKVEDLAKALKGILGQPEREVAKAKSKAASRDRPKKAEPKEQPPVSAELKEDQKRQIDQYLLEITGAFGKGDMKAVQALSSKILALDPQNEAASRFFTVAESSMKPTETEKLPSEEALPSSFVNGRYEVKEYLGEGIRKKVYLAHDTVLARDVAFALIKTEGLDDNAKKRVTREAQVMGQLGTYQHIVTVHDMGKQDGDQYVVMELMSEGDVADALAAVDARFAVCGNPAVMFSDFPFFGMYSRIDRSVIHFPFSGRRT